ncbi:MAG: hypothetical protein LKE39_11660 [Sphaerochaeta sp.]|jgi:hypothetical protein|nr:hypothetical protein [Sphaerochaeta sp.]
MNAQAIIYSSHAGHTQAYAQMLSAQLGIPTFPLSSCTLKENTEVVYLGWLRAGQVVGLSQALRRYTVLAIGVVGMSRLDQGRIARMKKKEGVTDGVYCFYLPGGFELSKTHGLNHFVMGIMSRTVAKSLKSKADKSPDDLETLEMFSEGKSLVGEENITQVVQRIKKL